MTEGFWFAMAALFPEDTKVEDLGEHCGPGGPYAIVVLLCQAKFQSRGGRVEGSLRALSNSAFLDGRDQAREIIERAGDVELLHVLHLDDRGFEVRFPAWSKWQERFRKAEARSQADPGGLDRTPPDTTGQGRNGPDAAVRATGTATATETGPSQRSVPTSLHSVIDLVDGVATCKGAALKSHIAVKACRDFADRNLAVEADKFAHYWRDGAGENRPLKDVAGAWRNWLRRAPRAATMLRSSDAAERRIQAGLRGEVAV